MKRNLLVFSFVIAVLCIMSSCKKEELVSVNGIVSGKLIDASTNTGLADVAITVQGTKIKGTTKTDGTFEVKGIPAGEYVMVFTKSGYMISKRSVYIELSGASAKRSNDIDFHVILEDNELCPLTGKANGVVFNEDGTLSSSATVTINYNDSTFTTTTDANGAFSFTSLPFNPNNYVYARAIKGDAFGGIDDSYGATPTKTLGFEIHLTLGDFKFLSGNFNKNVGNINFPVTSNIELTFSDVVDLATTLKKGSLKLYNASMGEEIGVDITASGNKLVINPKSDLAKDNDYRIAGSVYANENRSTSVNEYFSTVPATAIIPLDIATKPTLTMDAGKTTLTITCPTGANTIRIYSALGTNAEFTYEWSIGASLTTVTHNIAGDPTPTSYYVIAEGYDANGRPVYGAQSDVITK